jgi:hypothetical protein
MAQAASQIVASSLPPGFTRGEPKRQETRRWLGSVTAISASAERDITVHDPAPRYGCRYELCFRFKAGVAKFDAANRLPGGLHHG